LHFASLRNAQSTDLDKTDITDTKPSRQVTADKEPKDRHNYTTKAASFYGVSFGLRERQGLSTTTPEQEDNQLKFFLNLKITISSSKTEPCA
jgi:hypothetical protein